MITNRGESLSTSTAGHRLTSTHTRSVNRIHSLQPPPPPIHRPLWNCPQFVFHSHNNTYLSITAETKSRLQKLRNTPQNEHKIVWWDPTPTKRPAVNSHQTVNNHFHLLAMSNSITAWDPGASKETIHLAFFFLLLLFFYFQALSSGGCIAKHWSAV